MSKVSAPVFDELLKNSDTPVYAGIKIHGEERGDRMERTTGELLYKYFRRELISNSLEQAWSR